MSWDVMLEDRTAAPYCSFGKPPEQFQPQYPGEEPCIVPCYPAVVVARHAEGGTYVLGGTDRAVLNITYNYSTHYYRVLPDGLQEFLNDRRAGDALEALEQAVRELGTEQDDDYWADTPGNAGYALNILLGWAKHHPKAIFSVL